MTNRATIPYVVFSLLLLLMVVPQPGSAATTGCPAGQAIQGIDFLTKKLVCVDVNVEVAAPPGTVSRNSDPSISHVG